MFDTQDFEWNSGFILLKRAFCQTIADKSASIFTTDSYSTDKQPKHLILVDRTTILNTQVIP